LFAGLVSVPLSAKLTIDELRYRLSHSESAIFLVSSNLLDKALAALATPGEADIARPAGGDNGLRTPQAKTRTSGITDAPPPALVCLDSNLSREKLRAKVKNTGLDWDSLTFLSQAIEQGKTGCGTGRDWQTAWIPSPIAAAGQLGPIICYTSALRTIPRRSC
jgi:acyl-CoA synthetase (AMP-forming)/AMP-acid ligase II